MIPAAPSQLFQFCFHQYNRRLLSRSFQHIWMHRDSKQPPPSPALFVLNHSAWWDGLVCFHLNRLLKRSSYYMMHEKGLRQYPFFRRLGAFSVDRGSPKDVLLSLRYSAERLQNGESVWIFPQGDEKHLERRPLGFLPGFLYLSDQLPEVPVIPISLYYSFRHAQKPELFVQIGEPLRLPEGGTRSQRTLQAEAAFTRQLDGLRRHVIQENMPVFIPLQHWGRQL